MCGLKDSRYGLVIGFWPVSSCDELTVYGIIGYHSNKDMIMTTVINASAATTNASNANQLSKVDEEREQVLTELMTEVVQRYQKRERGHHPRLGWW